MVLKSLMLKLLFTCFEVQNASGFSDGWLHPYFYHKVGLSSPGCDVPNAGGEAAHFLFIAQKFLRVAFLQYSWLFAW